MFARSFDKQKEVELPGVGRGERRRIATETSDQRRVTSDK
jgi:hypothetical protein